MATRPLTRRRAPLARDRGYRAPLRSGARATNAGAKDSRESCDLRRPSHPQDRVRSRVFDRYQRSWKAIKPMADAVKLIWIKDRSANSLAIAALCLETPGHEIDWETDISRPMRVGGEKARNRGRFASRSSLRLRGGGARPHPLDRRIFGPAAGEVKGKRGAIKKVRLPALVFANRAAA